MYTFVNIRKIQVFFPYGNVFYYEKRTKSVIDVSEKYLKLKENLFRCNENNKS